MLMFALSLSFTTAARRGFGAKYCLKYSLKRSLLLGGTDCLDAEVVAVGLLLYAGMLLSYRICYAVEL